VRRPASVAFGPTDALAVARRGTSAQPGLAATLGLAAIAAGELTIALAPVKALALAGAVAMGIGVGTFTCNLAPVLMGTAPRSHLARIQALLSMAQSGVLLALNNVLGAVARAGLPRRGDDHVRLGGQRMRAGRPARAGDPPRQIASGSMKPSEDDRAAAVRVSGRAG